MAVSNAPAPSRDTMVSMARMRSAADEEASLRSKSCVLAQLSGGTGTSSAPPSLGYTQTVRNAPAP